jgi:glycogen debranching enzyme
MDDTIRIAESWYVLATSSRTDDRTRVLKHGETFAVFDRFGDVHPIGTGEHGVYHQGTRFLSQWELRVNGQRPMLLGSSVKLDNSLLTVDLTTPDFYEAGKLAVLKGTVHIARSRLLWASACLESVLITNYGEQTVLLQVALDFGADYADIFEARGFHRERRGEDMEPDVRADRVILGYRGLDGLARRTGVSCTPLPTRVTRARVEYALELAPKGQSQLNFTVTCEPGASLHAPADFAVAQERVERSLHDAQERACCVNTSNEQFNDWMNRSAADLVMLTADNPEGAFPYAGVPWYSTPFGRDGIITALLYLWADPAIARGVLAHAARLQATKVSPEQDAEPGKIFHETRKGELAALGEIPFGCYYGSVDSTPLFIILAAAYHNRTGDLAFLRGLWPNLQSALEWIDRYGDVDGDGFVEYQKKTERGLLHQGWKDSENAVFHSDGRPAEGPIALAEVQGYVYLAKRGAARLCLAMGERKQAQALARAAETLRKRFEAAFWCEEIGTYALALDGRKQRCVVRSSNAGQVLWSRIASPERARRTAMTLLAPHSFSGWGIRTVAEGEALYNPMSYHNGSIWPHDNALIGMGLAQYGMMEGAMAVMAAMFDASLFMDLHRLPELYCGFARRPNEGPTLYPVACSPQAWASASAFYLLQSCLGLSFHFESPHLRFDHPLLPEWLEFVEIRNLKVGEGSIDLSLERHPHDVGVHVLRRVGQAEVSVVL